MSKKTIKATDKSQIATGFLNFQSIGCKGGILISFILGIFASIIANNLS